MLKIKIYLSHSGSGLFKARVPEKLESCIDPDKEYTKAEIENLLDWLEQKEK